MKRTNIKINEVKNKLNIKKPKINIEGKKILKFIKFILLIIMLVLIYILSPKITNNIQAMAEYLYKLEPTYITRVVELVLAVSLVLPSVISNNKEEK